MAVIAFERIESRYTKPGKSPEPAQTDVTIFEDDQKIDFRQIAAAIGVRPQAISEIDLKRAPSTYEALRRLATDSMRPGYSQRSNAGLRNYTIYRDGGVLFTVKNNGQVSGVVLTREPFNPNNLHPVLQESLSRMGVLSGASQSPNPRV